MNHGPLVSPNVSVIAEIRWVSGQIRGIIEAIHAMHNSGLRHGNLKPQNILLRVSKEDPQGTLVITDIGSSPRFHPEKSTSNTSAESIFIDPIYRPPEFDIPGSFISRSADIWSLGCIFFEMACWLLGGEDLRRSCEEARASLDSAGFPSYTFFEFITSVKQGGDGQSRQYAQVKEGVTEVCIEASRELQS
jgi:serine/threonine protein kinase